MCRRLFTPCFALKTVSVFLLLMVYYSISTAQENIPVESSTKAAVIDIVAGLMRDHYVFADIGEKMGEHIRTKYANGEYDSYNDVKAFCREVTADLRDISHDKHIFVFYSPDEAKEVAASKGLLPAEECDRINAKFYESDRRNNFGFKKVEILEGNIGYLNLTYFSGHNSACNTAVAAMSFLSSSDAIIVDLRTNGGGGGGVGGLLASFFIDSVKAPLSGAYFRSTDEVEQNWTLPYVPGRRLPDIDLYILTSSRTFSAAEDFCYSLRQIRPLTVIGEVTKGGAHPVDVFIVKGDILSQLSIGESVNPITQSNWEGVGIKPDIEVPADSALQTSHLLALKSLLEKVTEDERKQELSDLISTLEAD